MFALVHDHMYEESVLIGIFTSKELVQEALIEYEKATNTHVFSHSLGLRILEIDHDPDLHFDGTTCGYCVSSHQEMFGQVCHNIEYVAKDPISAIQHAKRLHAQEKSGMESEWLYEPVEIDKVRLKDGKSTYIKEIDYSWNKGQHVLYQP